MLRRSFQRFVNWVSRLFFPIAVLWWKLTKPRTFGVKVAVEDRSGRILLVKVTYISNAAWVFPGGKIDKGETAAESARREVMEEVGVKIDELKPIGSYFSDKWGKQDTVQVFYGRAGDNIVKINEFEIKEAKWFGLNELPPLPPNNQKVFRMYERYLSERNK